MRMRALLGWVVSGALALSGAAVQAQGTQARIAGAIDDGGARVALAGAVSPLVQRAVDLGPVSADAPLTLSLRFSMTPAQQADLTALLAAQQDPGSALYHQWLSPEQFGARFGLAAADLAKVTAWLTAQGFTVIGTARGGGFVTFTGTAAQAQGAFGTGIDRLNVNGIAHFANTAAPSLPAALAGVTAAITGLDDFVPAPSVHAQAVKAPVSAAEGSAAEGSAQPEFTSPYSGNHYLAPGDIYKIYDESPLLSASTNGAGVTVAVMGRTDIRLTDIAAFRTAAGLSANVPTIKVYGADPGLGAASDVTESTLDVEWVGAAAPSATVLFVTSIDVLNGSLTNAIDDNVAPVIDYSYGQCEAGIGASQLAVYNQLLAQAAAQGITVIGPGGNAGATACDYNAAVATNGLAVEFPASSPFVTGVGGTMFNENGGTFWSTTNSTNSASALSYIPEVVWNEDSVTGALAASGGGASLYFAKPSWQVGTGVPADFSRDTPDVSLSAGIVQDPYLICEPGYCVNGWYSAAGYLDVAGGTDLTAAEFAGFMALVVQKQGRVGVANPTLYALANSSYAATVFHDVTAGSNGSPCKAGSPDCLASGMTSGFSAGTGYDQATGWGSVDVYNMVSDWGLVKALATTPAGTNASVTNVSGSPASVTAGTAITLTATVAKAPGLTNVTSLPTGTVQFTVDRVAVGSAVTLANGTATYTLATTALSAGSHVVQATYSGDAIFLGSKGAFTINVGSATAPDFTLTPATTSLTVPAGGTSQNVTFTVTPLNGFTGNVSFTVGGGANLAATAVFNPTTVTISGTSAATTAFSLLGYQFQAQSGTATAASRQPAQPWRKGAGVVLAGMVLMLLPRRRRLTGLLVLAVTAGMIGVSGCYSNTFRAGAPTRVNATPGTYVLTVYATGTANGSSVTHTATVNVTVQ